VDAAARLNRIAAEQTEWVANLDDLPRPCRTAWGQPKLAFRTQAQAAAHPGATGPGMNIYHCPHCGNYHIGHRPHPDRRGLRRRIRDALRSSR